MIPGFTGIFIVAIYSATLSSFSAFLSATGIVFLPVIEKRIYIPDDKKILASRMIMVIFGILTVALSIGMSKMQDTIIGILFMTTMNLGAPFFGAALSGMFLPFVNKTGVLAGMFAPVVPIGIFIVKLFGYKQQVGTTIASKMITDRIDDYSIYEGFNVTGYGCQVRRS
jgi:Na+/proline symporter